MQLTSPGREGERGKKSASEIAMEVIKGRRGRCSIATRARDISGGTRRERERGREIETGSGR